MIFGEYNEKESNVCIRRLRGVTGNKYMNGTLCDSRQITKKSCYIMQDNQLHPLVTVMEAMVFAANIKLSRSLTDIHKEQLVSIYS